MNPDTLDFYEIAKIDNQAPNFDLPYYDPSNDSDGQINLKDLHGKWCVLFFYPADFTFVCPTELKDMAEAKGHFSEMGVEVLACSTDTIFSHRAWTKHETLMKNFPYKMLADHSLSTADAYNLLDDETGIAGRWTYIIDPEWVIRWIEITSGALGRSSDELIRKIKALQYMAANPGQACPAKWVLWDKTLTPNIKFAWEVGEELKK